MNEHTNKYTVLHFQQQQEQKSSYFQVRNIISLRVCQIKFIIYNQKNSKLRNEFKN